MSIDEVAVQVGDKGRVLVFEKKDVLGPGQIPGSKYLRVSTVAVEFKDLPGRVAEVARVADVNFQILAKKTGGPEAGKQNDYRSFDGVTRTLLAI